MLGELGRGQPGDRHRWFVRGGAAATADADRFVANFETFANRLRS
jgi:hypothetical protein